VDGRTREVSERDQSTTPLDVLVGRRMPTGGGVTGGQGGAQGAPPGAEDPPSLPVAVTLSWGLF
jgi:hypothetical protein